MPSEPLPEFAFLPSSPFLHAACVRAGKASEAVQSWCAVCGKGKGTPPPRACCCLSHHHPPTTHYPALPHIILQAWSGRQAACDGGGGRCRQAACGAKFSARLPRKMPAQQQGMQQAGNGVQCVFGVWGMCAGSAKAAKEEDEDAAASHACLPPLPPACQSLPSHSDQWYGRKERWCVCAHAVCVDKGVCVVEEGHAPQP